MNTDKLKQYWQEKPLEVLVVASTVATAIAKVVDASSAAKGRRAYAKQVDYRVKKNR